MIATISAIKPLVGLAAWLAAGSFVAFRSRRRPAEAALALLFWPFFLSSAPAVATDRLRSALGQGPAADALVAELDGAMARLRARLARIDAALQTASPASRAVLSEARQRTLSQLRDAEAAIDEASTRLTLLDGDGDAAEVRALLQSLSARLAADEEVRATI